MLKPTRSMLEQAKKDMSAIIAEIVNEAPSKNIWDGKGPSDGDVMLEAAKRWREQNPDSPLFREPIAG